MKVDIASDLHLEHGYVSLPGGDVLVLAGDVCEAVRLQKSVNKVRNTETADDKSFRYADFFYSECTKYSKVFYVLGNHEHYHGKFYKTLDIIQQSVPSHVEVLENRFVDYGGVRWLGATLWTDCNRGDPLTALHLQQSMNDYKVVTNHYPEKGVYHKLTPAKTVAVHRETQQYFNHVLQEPAPGPVVVITHHAPSFRSVNETFRYDTLMNGGYASALDDWIESMGKPDYWIHGHMHDPVDYLMGNTRVIANPRGYLGFESRANTWTVKTLEL
jgi:Icc-related predicted phosphoesterase